MNAPLVATVVLLAAVVTASGTPRPRGLKLSAETSTSALTVGREHLELFKDLVKQAEDLFESTRNEEAAVALLRTAFVLCPSCRHDTFEGKKFREAFSIDNLDDRLYMTEQIIPAILKFQQPDSALKVLWAGCHPYTLRYEYLMRDAKVVTIDPNEAQAVYGSSNRHIVDILQRIDHHVLPRTFDVAVVNGVIGWGIDTKTQLTEFVRAVYGVLKDDGYLIVGYNRHFEHGCCQFEPHFERAPLGQLAQRKDFGGEWKHTYEVYRKVPVMPLG